MRQSGSNRQQRCGGPRPGARGSVARRGTVLVLVVGVLALMALIVLVYSTIGISDRRGAAALVDKTRVAEQSTALADYLAQVIGDSRLAVVAQTVTTAPGEPFQTRLIRKTWDYPSTEWSSVSVPRASTPWLGFEATGGIRYVFQSNLLDPRAGATPWLSVNEPAYLDAGVTSITRVTSPLTGTNSVVQGGGAYAELFRDLRHLSVFTPDGRFISKLALRGNFDAEPGYRVDGRGFIRSSANLWALDFNGVPAVDDAQSISGDPVTAYNGYLPWIKNGTNSPALVATDANVPYMWSENQYQLHRQVGSEVQGVPDEQRQPGGRFNLDNVFADADGDGFYDSRWGELVSLRTGTPRSVVAQYGQMRWVFAAKAVDLSGMVNVNTAVSFAEPGTGAHPPGETPADIDLERLLSLRDARRLFTDRTGRETLFTSPWYPNLGAPVNSPSNYSAYDSRDGTNAEEVGGAAFAALLEARLDTMPPAGKSFARGDVPAVSAIQGGVLSSAARAAIYQQYSRNTKGAVAPDPADPVRGIVRQFSNTFALGDEQELRTRHGLNDAEHRSALEVTIDGRSATAGLRDVGPLRSNRGAEFELVDYTADPLTEATAMTLLATGVRRDITTVSSSVALRSDPTGRTQVATLGVDSGGFQVVTPRGIQSGEIKPDAMQILEQIYTGYTPVGTNPTPVDQLLAAYATSLMPDAGEIGNSPDKDVWGVEPAQHVLNYGGRVTPTGATRTRIGGNGAEVALRTAATMATNLVAERAFELQGAAIKPYRAAADAIVTSQLLINEDERSNLTTSVGTNPQAFPVWNTAGLTSYSSANRPTLSMSLDYNKYGGTLGRHLADNSVAGDLSVKGGLVLFGVRPQPVLTQAAYYVMYSNAPVQGSSAGGNSRDREWTDSGVPNVPPTPGPATIYGAVDVANDDFIMEMFAVQITNPWDRDIGLTGVLADGTPTAGAVNDTDVRYYLEYNGRFFKIVDIGSQADQHAAIVLKAGESRTFYALTQTPEEIATRMNAVAPGGTGTINADKVSAMIESQLRTRESGLLPPPAHGGNPVRMVEFDRTTGHDVTSPTVDLFSGASPTQQRVVRLWRVMYDDTEEAGSANSNPLNDYLVDRLRDPGNAAGRATLNVQLPTAKQAISGTSVMPSPPATQEEYNRTRYSIMFAGSIRRPDDPQAPKAPRGAFPAYAIEAKTTATGFDTTSFNVTDSLQVGGADLPAGSMDISWFQQAGAPRLEGPIGLFEKLLVGDSSDPLNPVPSGVLLPSIARAANMRADKKIKDRPDAPGYVMAAQSKPFDAMRVPMRAIPSPRPLRPTEALATLAIGATLDPQQLPSAAPATEADLDNAWTTLGEALAIGSGYSTSMAPTGSAASYAYLFGHPVAGAVRAGQVRLDTFIPFNDTNNSGAFEQGVAPMGANRYVDPARGMGIPLAWNIINNLRLGPASAQGLININTASLAVLRTIPMLTADYMNQATGLRGGPWIAPGGAGINGHDLFHPGLYTWDIATVIKAYRDKTVEYTRGLFGADPVGWAADFSDLAARVPATTSMGDYVASGIGRRAVTGFLKGAGGANPTGEPLREAAGIMSPAEILAARLDKDFVYTGPYVDDRSPADGTRADSSIDRLGRMGEIVGTGARADRVLDVTMQGGVNAGRRVGLVPNWVKDPAGAGQPDLPADIPDSLEAKLSIADAVLNTITVRSDVFCVWFVLEGYSRSDVEGLDYLGSPTAVSDPNDESFARPMVPTISRRYMMVVDRSNVTSPGQKPKILLLQELPR